MRILSDFFDKIYCINLEERVDRWEKCLQIFQEYGIDSYEKINGVRVLEQDYPYLENKSRSQLGCAISFYKIIKNAYKNNYKNILILEDDFYFIYPKEQTENILKNSINKLPKEWDVLYLGANIMYSFSNSPMSYFDKYLFKINSAYCMHSIAFSNRAISKIIYKFPSEDYFINKMIQEYKAIDIFMAKEFCFENLCFIPNEILCNQSPSFSSIEGINCDYSKELIERFQNSKNTIC